MSGTLIGGNRLRSVEIEEYEIGRNTEAGGTELLTINAPEGELWTAIQARIAVAPPEDATEGDHDLQIKDPGQGFMGILEGQFDHDARIEADYGAWSDDGQIEVVPTTELAFIEAIKNIHVTNDTSIDLEYENNTDADKDSTTGVVRIFWRKYDL